MTPDEWATIRETISKVAEGVDGSSGALLWLQRDDEDGLQVKHLQVMDLVSDMRFTILDEDGAPRLLSDWEMTFGPDRCDISATEAVPRTPTAEPEYHERREGDLPDACTQGAGACFPSCDTGHESEERTHHPTG